MTVTGRTTLFVIVGDPIAHTLSPAMQNAALEAAGIDGVYIPWRVKPARFAAALACLRGIENFGGANVTLPHKEAALSLVDEASPEAVLVGAVNTLVPKAGRLIGANTDGQGFLRSLQEDGGVTPRGRAAVILGAGGAARAVAWSLAGAGVARLTIVNRTVERAESLAEAVSRQTGLPVVALGPDDRRLPERAATCDLLVNASSVGLDRSDRSPIDPGMLGPQTLVHDLIYRPQETALLREAAARGCRVLGGLGMLLHQGALAFELWTGQKPSYDAMRRALMHALT
jgi:shikimate dehydrogenase